MTPMTASGFDPWKMSVYWRLPMHLQALRRIMQTGGSRGGRAELIRVGESAGEISAGYPLHMVSNQFEIEGYADKLTGAHVTAVLIAVVWILCGEDARTASAMVTDWPELPLFAFLSRKGEKAAA